MSVTENEATVNGTRAWSGAITTARLAEMISQSFNPNYIPPLAWDKVGRLAFRNGYQLEDYWPDEMKRGWWAVYGIISDSLAADSYSAAIAFVEAV